jgi:hypothetical protein
VSWVACTCVCASKRAQQQQQQQQQSVPPVFKLLWQHSRASRQVPFNTTHVSLVLLSCPPRTHATQVDFDIPPERKRDLRDKFNALFTVSDRRRGCGACACVLGCACALARVEQSRAALLLAVPAVACRACSHPPTPHPAPGARWWWWGADGLMGSSMPLTCKPCMACTRPDPLRSLSHTHIHARARTPPTAQLLARHRGAQAAAGRPGGALTRTRGQGAAGAAGAASHWRACGAAACCSCGGRCAPEAAQEHL